MLRLISTLLPLAALASCALQQTPPDVEAGTDATTDSVTGPTEEAPVELAVVVTEPPNRCEQLLESLEKTQPLIEDLDSSLADYAARVEAALDRLEKPEPPTRSMTCPDTGGSTLDNKDVIGAIEWVFMSPPGRHYRARVDSGAETSSLSAKDVVEFERDGDDWVRFVFEHDNSDSAVELELPVTRVVLIRQAAVEQLDRRVVVELDIRLGDRLQRTEFTLTDRSQMTYPVLLGRAFLMDLYVIDVAQSYTHPRYEAP
jgi:hypothetical protein